MRPSNRLVVLAAALTLSLGACGGEVVGPFNPIVTNQVDAFELTAIRLRNVTQTSVHSWANSGTTAVVNVTISRLKGTATLTILDANGAQVYQADLVANGTAQTAAGVPGDWTIHLLVQEYDGDIAVKVDKL